jgi:hypothetical protein
VGEESVAAPIHEHINGKSMRIRLHSNRPELRDLQAPKMKLVVNNVVDVIAEYALCRGEKREKDCNFLSVPTPKRRRTEAVRRQPARRHSEGEVLAGRFQGLGFVLSGGISEVYNSKDIRPREPLL